MFIFRKYTPLILAPLLSFSCLADSPPSTPLSNLHRFTEYPEKCEKAVHLLQQMPEIKALLARIQQEGSLSIALYGDKKSQFDAFWDGEKRTIFLNPYCHEDLGETLCSIIYELHNAKTNKQFLSLATQARQALITKEEYVESVEKIEFQNALDTHKLLEKGIERGFFPSTAYLNVYYQFEDYYKAQQLMGHSKWLADCYDYLNKQSKQTYRGTIPHLHKMSPLDKREMLNYLAIKNSLANPSPEVSALARSRMQEEYQRLICSQETSQSKRKQNNWKMSLFSLVFQGSQEFEILEKNSPLYSMDYTY